MQTSPQEPSQQAAAIAPDAASAPGLKNRGQSDAPPGPKFSLRTLLIATAVIAVVASAIGYGYRAVHPASRPAFISFWAGLFSVLLIYVGLRCYDHLRRRRLAGQIRFTFTRVDGPRPLFFTLLIGWGVCMLALFGSYVFVEDLIRGGNGSPMEASEAGLVLGVIAVIGLHLLYRPFVQAKPIRLGDRGFIVGDRPMPWTNVSSAAWNVLHPSQLQLSTSHERPYIVEVPLELREPLEAFLAERTHFAT